MSDTMWIGLVLAIIIVAGYLLLHTKIAAFFSDVHNALNAVRGSGDTGVKEALEEIGAVVQSLQDVVLAHHDALRPDINKLVAAIPAPIEKRPISTDHMDVPASDASVALNEGARLANRKRLDAWAAKVPNYTDGSITAAELTVIWKKWITWLSSGASCAMNELNWDISYLPFGCPPNPEMELEAKFLREGATTESERVFVNYRDNSDLGLLGRFNVAADGTVTPR